MTELLALGIQQPQINTLQNFEASQNAAIGQKSAVMQQEQAAHQAIAEHALGVMGGKLDGPVDPEALKQWVGELGASNDPHSKALAAQLQANPNLVPVMAKGSLSVLQAGQDQAKIDLAQKQYELDLQNAAVAARKGQFVEMTPGGTLHDTTGAQPDFTAPAKPPDNSFRMMTPEEIKTAGLPEGNAYQIDTVDGKITPISGANNGLSVTTNPDGTVSVTQGGPGGKALTEGQSKDLVFVTRASGALDTLNMLGGKLTSLGEDAVNNVPYGKYLQSEEYQQAKQAGDEFISAILRKDSGAAITPDERKSYGDTYLPGPGDKPALLKQKEAARNRAVKAIAMGLPAAAILSLEQNDVNIPNLADTKNPGAGVPKDAAETKTVDGKTYYRLGADWYEAN